MLGTSVLLSRYKKNPHLMRVEREPVVRIELTANGLQNRCSTTELHRPRPSWLVIGYQKHTALSIGILCFVNHGPSLSIPETITLGPCKDDCTVPLFSLVQSSGRFPGVSSQQPRWKALLIVQCVLVFLVEPQNEEHFTDQN